MANKTPNYNLTKPLASEFYDVEVQNDNMDIIDTQLKALDSKSASAKTTLADADTLPLNDSADSSKLKKITWANIKTVLGNLFAAKSHGHALTDSNITGTLAASKGGTGKTNLKDAGNSIMNALDTGSSTPADNDYYISQYVNGGSTTTTYHRRPMSALWAYIKTKTDSLYAAKSHNHAASNINSGTLSSDRLPTVPVEKGGTGATTAANARTNLGITPANIGAALSNHTHNYAGSSSAGGSATSAVKLQTARTLTIGNSGKTFDGSGNQSWTLAEIGAAAAANLKFSDYTHVSQIGLTQGEETLEDIARAMPDYSRLIISVNNVNNQDIFPHPYGLFRVTKFDAYRIVFEFNGRVEGTTPGQYWIASATLDGSSYVVNGWYSIFGEHNKPSAANIQAGTFAGQVVANASAVSAVGTKQMRNIYAGTADMTAGTTALPSGDIYLVYE